MVPTKFWDVPAGEARRACGWSSPVSTDARSGVTRPAGAADDRVVSPPQPSRPTGSCQPFVGSAAIAAGRVTPHHLRTGCRRLFPDVYLDATCPITPGVMVRAATLWAPAGSVLGGAAAALLHGERWYAPRAVMIATDLYCAGTPRPAAGIRIRRMSRDFPPDHVVTDRGIHLTAPGRTAADLARWERDDDEAIAKIDAVCNRSEITTDVVAATLDRMQGLHGVSRVRSLLPWCDGRADSPPETRLRLMLVRAGLPAPTPQLEIRNEYGVKIATADLGYEQQKVAIFYDSELHREKSTWEYDALANAQMAELGWERFRVTAQMMRSPGILTRQIGAAVMQGDRRG